MGEVINIYGANVRIPDLPDESEIINSGKDRLQQKWKKEPLPSYFDKVAYDKDGNLLLTQEQQTFAAKEVLRYKQGVFIYINGTARYIPPKYYFFLKYYILEDGSAPDFREADRLWFLFLRHWEKVEHCLGTVRTKKRRTGASSQACSNLIYEAIFFKNSNCGLISKTKDDSKDTFTEMITAAYRQLPAFLKPKQLNKEDTVSEIVLAHKSKETGAGLSSAIKEDEGHRSKINYRAPVINAYDRSRQSRVLIDEGAKFPKETPTSQLLSIILKTVVKGVKRVGFIELCSTVNEMTKGGGSEYKKIWDAANQFKRTPTVNRLVRFFQPAFEAYEGFIDEYGDSVIGEPTDEQYDYLVKTWVKYDEDGNRISELSEDDILLGAKYYVKVKRREGLEGMDLEEEMRQNPCDEDEAFMFIGVGCEFNAARINAQIKELEENPPLIRQSRLVVNKKEFQSPIPGSKKLVTRTVDAMDDEMGGWFILEYPDKKNNFEERSGKVFPKNKHLFQIGADTVKDDFAINGSKPTVCVMKKSHIVNGEETGMYPVAFWLGKARLTAHFDEEVFKACLFWGCTVNYELDAGTEYYRKFCTMGGRKLLEWTPRFAIDPANPNQNIKPGTQSGNPFQLNAQLEVAKMYFDGTSQETYNGFTHLNKFISVLRQALKYDHSNRTPYDEMIALMMALLPMMGQMAEPEDNRKDEKPKSIWPRYEVKMTG